MGFDKPPPNLPTLSSLDPDKVRERLNAIAKEKADGAQEEKLNQTTVLRTHEAGQDANTAFADALCERGVGCQAAAKGTRMNEMLDKAEYWYRETLKEDDDHVGALVRLGVLLTMRKRLAEAEEFLLHALDVDGQHHPTTRRALNVIQVMCTIRYSDTVDMLTLSACYL